MCCIIENWIAFLFKDQLMSGGIIYHWNIIPINLWDTWDRNINHSKFISQASWCIYDHLHSHKLGSKYYVSTVDYFFEYHCFKTELTYIKKTDSWSSTPFVPCMITVDKYMNIYFFPSWLWGIYRHCLFGILINLYPITFLECTVVNNWIGWIIY